MGRKDLKTEMNWLKTYKGGCMQCWMVREKGSREAQLLVEKVGQGVEVTHDGWSIYATKEAAEDMLRWCQRDNVNELEVVEMYVAEGDD